MTEHVKFYMLFEERSSKIKQYLYTYIKLHNIFKIKYITVYIKKNIVNKSNLKKLSQFLKE